jgi:hypothetical protein
MLHEIVCGMRAVRYQPTYQLFLFLEMLRRAKLILSN